MPKLRTIGWSLLILSFSVYVAAQDSTQQGPAPAYGQTAPVLNPENPPVSSIDEPGLDLKMATRSFISPSIQLSETADSNENNNLNVSSVRSVSHVLGALDLQQFWQKSDFIMEYLGGGAFNTAPYQTKQLHAFGAEAITRWRTGTLKLRDAMSYVPDGSFNLGSAGGLPGLGIATGLGTGEAGGGLPGMTKLGPGTPSIANIPRFSNTVVLDAVQAITPRSAVTVLGAFGSAHFYHNTLGLIDSDQTTVEVGYSHMISRRDQIGGILGFQLFRFPYSTGGQIFNDVFNLRYSHTISGRMRFIVGAGPQYTDLQSGGQSNIRWSLSGRASLRYQFPRSSLVLNWEKYTSTGSGFFAGADVQVVRVAFMHPIGRTYVLLTDAGFAHNKRLQAAGSDIFSGSSYNDGSAGCILRKHISRTFDAFAAYRFSEVDLSQTGCEGSICGKIAQRHRGSIGIEWHPRPTRIE